MTKNRKLYFISSVINIIIGVLILPLFSLATVAANDEHKAIISAYMDAYNRCDLNSIMPYFHPDIEWLSIEGSTIKVVSSGKETLLKDLESYMKGGCTSRSEISNWSINGNYITVRETAFWQSADQKQHSQSATAVYEIQDKKIRRVWYYPAIK